ncbi:MAG: N-acetylneuraminate synthase [Candidatus Omnitrophica bacterium CG11_big_fil_rev_8_21_14_0_20_63_9]|nr:MAG: N-acetylneuraminate synthase [Candidatus Omnitrophica bacterium CG11_big_fil_rev_8_21_14_0_20_63_9]
MTPRVQIGTRAVGPDEPCFIIAEAGSNHNRDRDLAKRLIDAAADAGADAVKFQAYSAETLYAKKTPPFAAWAHRTSQSPWEMMKAAELPRQWLAELAAYAATRGLTFLCTPFDHDAIDQLAALGIPAFKIASFELVDLELIRHAAGAGKPMILSTGMASNKEIEEAVGVCRAAGNEQVILLHCISLYPTPPHLANLRAIQTLASAFQVPVGFSDHTLGIELAAPARALGACVIEKHYTVSRTLEGPDHHFALEPDELQAMVRSVRAVEQALGTGLKAGPMPEEAEMYRWARRSLVAATRIAKGARITREMVTIKRPGYGVAPKDLDRIIGRQAAVDIEADEVMTWEMV